MDDWSAQDRSAFQAVLATRNIAGLPLWVLVTVVHSATALILSTWQPASWPGVPYFLPLISLAMAGVAAFGAWRSPHGVMHFHALLSSVLVLIAGLTVAGVLVAAPAAVAPVAAGLLLASIGAGLLFTWEVPLVLGVQGGLLALWAVAVALGPGWRGDPAQVGSVSLLLVGGGCLAGIVQRQRLVVSASAFQRQRELERATEVVDTERRRVRRSGQAKDQLFSDVTNGLREPVVRMLRELHDRRSASPEASEQLRSLWMDGLRLLRKLDDLGTLALYQRGYLRLRARRVDLAAELERVVSPVQERAREMGVEVVLVQEGTPEDVHIDPARFERIVLAMLAEALRTCDHYAEVQVELRIDRLATGTPLARIEVWCDRPEEPVDRGSDDDFWREPEGDRVELRLARALAEMHAGRLVEPTDAGDVLSWQLALRSGTEHLTDELIDRRVRDRGGGRGRRFEDREGMVWAHKLSESEEYRLVEIGVIVDAGVAEQARQDAGEAEPDAEE